MSTEVKDTPESGGEQPEFVKQIKGEMNRKLDKQAEQITSLMKQQQDLLAALQAAQSKPAPKQEVTESELSDLAFNDPKKFAQVVSKQATEEAQKITDARIAQERAAAAAQLEVQQTVAQLAGEYPELADQDSDLVKTTLEIIGTIPEAQRGGLAYKYAVKEAAGRLDMKPRSKREDEQFVGSTYSPPKGRSRARSDAQAVEQGRGFAQALGVNIDDPKFKETYLSKRVKYNGHTNDMNMAKKLDALAELEEFENTVLPKLRRMLAKGEDAAQMYKEFQSLIAARVITEALTAKDGKQMLAAAKEVLDRGTGKAKETINVTSRYEQLSEADLDALIRSEKDALDELEH